MRGIQLDTAELRTAIAELESPSLEQSLPSGELRAWRQITAEHKMLFLSQGWMSPSAAGMNPFLPDVDARTKPTFEIPAVSELTVSIGLRYVPGRICHPRLRKTKP